MPVENSDLIADEAITEAESDAEGLVFAEEARAELRSRLRERADLVSSDEELDQARRNARTVIDEAKRIARLHGRTVVDDFAVREALKSLCPIFPFC